MEMVDRQDRKCGDLREQLPRITQLQIQIRQIRADALCRNIIQLSRAEQMISLQCPAVVFFVIDRPDQAGAGGEDDRRAAFGKRCKLMPEGIIFIMQPQKSGKMTGERAAAFPDSQGRGQGCLSHGHHGIRGR